MEFVTARASQSESTGVKANTPAAIAAAPVPCETAPLQFRAKPVALQHRPIPGRAQVWRRIALYVLLAGVAAIGSLLVAVKWRALDQPAGDALPVDNPPVTATINESTPLPVHVDPQFAEDAPQSAAEGQLPPEAIGPVELAELLARARQQIEEFALTTPPGDNALETLQRVLGAMPGQPDALQGIHDIASRYAVLAAQAEQRGEYDLAKRYLDKGLVVVPDHPDLLAIQRKLAAQRKLQRDSSQTDRLSIAPKRPVGTTK